MSVRQHTHSAAGKTFRTRARGALRGAVLGALVVAASCDSETTPGPKLDTAPVQPPSSTALVGTVIDLSNAGAPLGDVAVELRSDAGQILATTRTNAGGHYALDATAHVGSVVVRLEKSGWVPSWQDHEVVSGQVLRVDAALTKYSTQTITIPTSSGSALSFASGLLRQSDDGSVSVSADNATVTIQPDSLFDPEFPDDVVEGEAEVNIAGTDFSNLSNGFVVSNLPSDQGYPLFGVATAFVEIVQDGRKLQPRPEKPIILRLATPSADSPIIGDEEAKAVYNYALANLQLFYVNPETGVWELQESAVTYDADAGAADTELKHLCGWCYAPPPPPQPRPVPITAVLKDAFGHPVYGSDTFPINYPAADGSCPSRPLTDEERAAARPGGITLLISVQKNNGRTSSTDSTGTASFGVVASDQGTWFNVGLSGAAGGIDLRNPLGDDPETSIVEGDKYLCMNGVRQRFSGPHQRHFGNGEVHYGVPLDYCIETGDVCESNVDTDGDGEPDTVSSGRCCDANAVCVPDAGVCLIP